MKDLKFLHLEHWAVLYSPSQRAFQYETVKDTMFTHIEAFLNNRDGIDYVLLAIVETQNDAIEAIQYFKGLWAESNDAERYFHSIN